MAPAGLAVSGSRQGETFGAPPVTRRHRAGRGPSVGGRGRGPAWLFVGFNVFVLGMLALDLGVFHRKAHAVSFREAAIWTAVWIGLALAFNAASSSAGEAGLEFLTGYLIEKALSVDNVFVFVLIFGSSPSRRSISTGCCSGASWARW